MNIQCLVYGITIIYLWQHDISARHQKDFHNIRIDYDISIMAYITFYYAKTIMVYDIVIDYDIIIIGL